MRSILIQISLINTLLYNLFLFNRFRESITTIETDKNENFIVDGYIRTNLFATFNRYIAPISGELNKSAGLYYRFLYCQTSEKYM